MVSLCGRGFDSLQLHFKEIEDMSEFQNISSFVLFLNQPVFHVVGFAFALKIELYIVQGVTYLLEWRFWVEVGIARGQHLTDIAQTPDARQFDAAF